MTRYYCLSQNSLRLVNKPICRGIISGTVNYKPQLHKPGNQIKEKKKKEYKIDK